LTGNWTGTASGTGNWTGVDTAAGITCDGSHAVPAESAVD